MGKCASKKAMANRAANMDAPLPVEAVPPAGGPPREGVPMGKGGIPMLSHQAPPGNHEILDEKGPRFIAPGLEEDEVPTRRVPIADSLELHPIAVKHESLDVPSIKLGQSAGGVLGTPKFDPHEQMPQEPQTFSLNPNVKQVEAKKLRKLNVQFKNPFKEVERRENIQRIEEASARGEIPPYYAVQGAYVLDRKEDGSIYGRPNPEVQRNNEPYAYERNADAGSVSSSTSEESRRRRRERRRRRRLERQKQNQGLLLSPPTGKEFGDDAVSAERPQATATPVLPPSGGEEPDVVGAAAVAAGVKDSASKADAPQGPPNLNKKPPTAPPQEKEPAVQQQQQRDPAVSPLPQKQASGARISSNVDPAAKEGAGEGIVNSGGQKGQTTPEPKTRPIPEAAKPSSKSPPRDAAKDPEKPKMSAMASEGTVVQQQGPSPDEEKPATPVKKRRKKKKKKKKLPKQISVSSIQAQEDKYYSMGPSSAPAYDYDDARQYDDYVSPPAAGGAGGEVDPGVPISQLMDGKGY